jgi:hypothetical protein
MARNVIKDVGEKEPSYTVGNEINTTTMENSMEDSQKN